MNAVLAAPPPVVHDDAGLLAPLVQRLADEPALAQRARDELGIADLAAAQRSGLEPERAEALLDRLDIMECEERLESWRRADSYTHGRERPDRSAPAAQRTGTQG